MEEREMKQEKIKQQKLIDTAQQQLDSAKKSKAPKSTIKFLEQRVKALGNRKAKLEAFKVPKPKTSSGEQDESSATKSKVVKQTDENTDEVK